MSFQSLAFLAFLALTVFACLGVGRRSRRAGLWLLLAACAVFCLWGFPDRRVLGGFLVLLGGGIVTWAGTRDFSVHPKRKKAVFLTALLWLIGTLLWYKYAGAITGGWMPLGLSFFTFQQVSYVIDAYRGQTGDYSFLQYAAYVAYFPQLIAGPIVTHDELIPQFLDQDRKRFQWENFSPGLFLFTLGLAKKVLIADTFGKVAD